MSIDSNSRDVLANRAVGQFPISIATSLAVESAIGILPEAPTDSPEIRKRNLMMVNVRTLMRNLYGSLEKEQKARLTEYTMAETLSNEMRTIESIVAEHSDGRGSCNFYLCSYADVANKFSRSLIKTPNTPAQVGYANIEAAVYKFLQTEFVSGTPVSAYTRDFPNTHAEAMLITHYPIDLLQRYKFNSLVLLESHTGAVKTPSLWNTKLQNGRELEQIPFDRMTLQMFGDGVMFSPMVAKVRSKVIELALKDRWTPITTKERIISTIEANHDPALEVLVKDLYRK